MREEKWLVKIQVCVEVLGSSGFHLRIRGAHYFSGLAVSEMYLFYGIVTV